MKTRKTHADLGDGFFDLVKPAVFPQTILRYRNQRAGRYNETSKHDEPPGSTERHGPVCLRDSRQRPAPRHAPHAQR